ncbi:lysosomal alpha-mannosidase-like [Gigantopelta aegis]|uniref:lysosomal alpha-mannosidase-like n=1 Tax=Gigantopelta aegis TaxID=1735272 RepID=UPI001B88768B|nr:lysosomal alpha-mannosidase-like [Gigantopelta aegis]
MGKIHVVCKCTFGLPNKNDGRQFSQDSCGYASCNPVKDGMINVHLVPHTHDDVGWLKTVDQYYYQELNHIQVQFILDSVIPELDRDPSKRFIYVEIAFFARWFREQLDPMRHTVKRLVNEGRLEFILGGWCMNDEGATHYNAIIDQHTLGFEFLRTSIGDCARPRIAWQIDPFGHSREQASIFAQFGFDALFFGRLHYQDKAKRLNTTTLEMVWHGSPQNLGEKSDLFTGVNYNLYNAPDGFCYDIHCDDPPIMDDERMHDYNVNETVENFLKAVKDQASHYATNHIMMTMGSDFQYQNANNWFKNLDKLIQYVNSQQSQGSNVNLIYSTPSCYTFQVNRANKTWTTKTDDFYPYAQHEHSIWTGFYTSRAALKGYDRRTNNFLQVVMQMDALAKLEDTDNSTYNIQILKESMGVNQHHDGISGTSKQVVADDYAERLASGVMEGQKVVNDAYRKLLPIGQSTAPGQSFCTLLNISYCHVTETNSEFQVLMYNPIGRSVTYYMEIPLPDHSVTVTGPNGEIVPSQVYPISPGTLRIPERNGSLATYQIFFEVQLPPLGFSTYFIKQDGSLKSPPKIGYRRINGGPDVVIGNEYISLTFDGSSGKLKQMKNLKKNIDIELSQEYMYYIGFPGNSSEPKFQASGAYVFRPKGTVPHNITVEASVNSFVSEGVLVQEVYQVFSSWLTQVVRVYETKQYAEFRWTVGPIAIGDKTGKEVINMFRTKLKSESLFYTDANGREILQRKRNHRDTWKLNLTEPIAENYYPVNSRIYIQDKSKNIQFTVLTDRSEGGSSIQDGELEIMVHRRLLYDDSLGVHEPLNETGLDRKGLIVRGSHYMFLDSIDSSAALHRDLAEKLFMAPSISFTTEKMAYADWSKKFRTNWSGLKQSLPDNVHLLTLEQFAGSGPAPSVKQPYLLRLEHFYERNEDTRLSQPVTVSLKDLFVPFDVTNVVELTLGANMPLSQLNRLKWKTTDGQPKKDTTLRFEPASSSVDPLSITLDPMEIRTFQVDIS